MTTLIIYHSYPDNVPCPDGIAAAWVAKKKYPDAKIQGCVYGDLEPVVFESDKLIVVDFSFPKKLIREWNRLGIETHIIDHHKTALDDLSGFTESALSKFTFDMNECGASLTWKTLFPDKPMPVFLEFIKDRDLWDFKYPETNAIHSAMGFMGRTFELFDLLEKCSRDEVIAILRPLGDKLLEPRTKAIEKACDRYEYGVIAGCEFIPFVSVRKEEEYLISDICQKLYTDKPDAYFVACVTESNKWSLRSNKHGNNTDVGSICKLMGGGGHRNAGGFTLTLKGVD